MFKFSKLFKDSNLEKLTYDDSKYFIGCYVSNIANLKKKDLEGIETITIYKEELFRGKIEISKQNFSVTENNEIKFTNLRPSFQFYDNGFEMYQVDKIDEKMKINIVIRNKKGNAIKINNHDDFNYWLIVADK